MSPSTRLVPLLLLAVPARAELPLPVFPECGEEDRPDLCPSDLDEDWELISYVPLNSRKSIREEEKELGSGMRADRAWRVTTGRFDVLVAVADSGIEWNSHHLVNKLFINTGELPRPQHADGTEADSYDLNGDGIENVADWALDPRVDITAGRDVADSMLDPSDLIYTFSDGVDDDGNGYIDDISGWDFFGRDNDAWHEYHDGFGDHGSGVAEEAAAEGGDEDDGRIGVCPNCAILPVRVGDTFITDGNRAAEAISFAVDSGAVAITQAVGALSNPEAATAAARYAFDQGVTIVGAAGDENSYHHNFPAVLDNIVYTHSIRHNTGDDGAQVYSYMNTWNCNNFGARLVVVSPSSACATGAVAGITGLVGLIRSAALDAGVDLSAGEVYQIIAQTAGDVWLTDDELERSKAYPSEEGWDPFFGYGRVDAEGAVLAVTAGEIPPTVTIDSPAWFVTVDPTLSPTLVVEGTVLPHEASQLVSWEVEVGLGHDPREWTTVQTGSAAGGIDGTLAEIDLSDVPLAAMAPPDIEEGILGRLERVNEPAFTVRVRATNETLGTLGEMRKTLFVHRDPDLRPGFPYELGASGESSPVLADLDGDGIFEIIIATSGGRVLALHGDGSDLSGWPVLADTEPGSHPDAPAFANGAVPVPRDGFVAGVAVGDLDGDGSPEVVAASGRGDMYAWHANGERVAGFPVHIVGRQPEEYDDNHTYDEGYAAAPVLYDLDGDGTREIVAPAMDSRLYVYAADASDWGPYPLDICYPSLCGEKGFRIIDSPAVGDVDGDGEVEIAFGTNEAANDGKYSVSYLVDALTGADEPGWPRIDSGLVNEAVLLPVLGEGHPASPAFADLDGDGDLEIANPIMLGTTDLFSYDGEVALEVAYYADGYTDGTDVDDSLAPMIVQMVTNPAFGDLNGDGVPDYVLGGASSIYLASLALTQHKDYQQAVGAWDGTTGEMLPGWPRQIEDVQFLMAPAIADVSGDGRPEVIYGSAGYLVHAWDGEGQLAAGWPKFTGNWLLGSPAIGDIDGDGYLDVVVSTREGWLFAWTTRGRADQDVQWASAFHDPQNTGNYETPLATQAGPVPDEGEAELRGCCKKDGDSKEALLLLLPIGIGAVRRRGRTPGGALPPRRRQGRRAPLARTPGGGACRCCGRPGRCTLPRDGMDNMTESGPPPDGGNGRILVVDDETLLLKSLKRVLRGHEVDLAETAAEAMAHVEVNGDYCLILCDLTLDDTASGMDLHRQLTERGTGGERALVFMTGWPKDADRQFLEGLPNPFILKPFNSAEIRELANRFVHRG